MDNATKWLIAWVISAVPGLWWFNVGWPAFYHDGIGGFIIAWILLKLFFATSIGFINSEVNL